MNVSELTKLLVCSALLFPTTLIAKEEQQNLPTVKFGVITDVHHSNKPDTPTRKYSTALAKGKVFIQTMEQNKVDFIIELGDFVDTLVDQKDPIKNLAELENVFTSFNGPAYHVLGNHEFDNVTREVFLKSISSSEIPAGKTFYSWNVNGIHFVVLDADYTTNAPHRPFDMNTPENTSWIWKDAYIPEHEIKWLIEDLEKSDLPTVVFTHQTLDRVDEQDHNVKNASQVRKIFENDGQVMAVFSGHDHRGGYANIKNIHYFVLSGNVGVDDSRSWDITSRTNGFDTVADNQFAIIEITQNNVHSVQINVVGYGRQPSYSLSYKLK